MARIFCTLILFAAIGVQAQTTFAPPVGKWIYQGDHKITTVREFKTIKCLDDSASCSEQEELSAEGYFCKPKGSKKGLYQCSKLLTTESSPELERKMAHLHEASLKLYEAIEKPKLILNTEYLKQYQVAQKALLRTKDSSFYFVYPSVEYGVYKTHMNIYIAEEGDEDKSIFELRSDSADLSVQRNYDIGTDNAFKRFTVHMIWKKEAPASAGILP